MPTFITRSRLPWVGVIPTCIGFTSTGKITALRTREASRSPMTLNVFAWASWGLMASFLDRSAHFHAGTNEETTYSQPKKEINGLLESRLLGVIAASLV